MPWQGRSLVEIRESFIADYETGAWTVTSLAAEYAVSRKTACKWIARFRESGRAGLGDRSRRPHTSPQATADDIRAWLCAARLEKPRWSPEQGGRWLRRHAPQRPWPSRVTIAKIWRDAQLYPGPVARPRPCYLARPRPAADTPNALWTVDFKGDFRVGTGARCYPLTLRDQASRFTLRCTALAAPDRVQTQRELERAFREFGLPQCIRSDNGEPFAGPGLAGLSQLNVTWLRLGIHVDQIDPGRPDQNGSHEQFHRVLKAHTARPPAATLRSQQRRFDRFRREYNEERPHAALGHRVPADDYRPSARPWPRQIPPVEYPGHWDTRVVQPNGRIQGRGASLFLSRALAAERVGLEEVDEGIWTVHFATVPLARWLAHERRLRPIVRR